MSRVPALRYRRDFANSCQQGAAFVLRSAKVVVVCEEGPSGKDSFTGTLQQVDRKPAVRTAAAVPRRADIPCTQQIRGPAGTGTR
jgi:hypothetical protein